LPIVSLGTRSCDCEPHQVLQPLSLDSSMSTKDLLRFLSKPAKSVFPSHFMFLLGRHLASLSVAIPCPIICSGNIQRWRSSNQASINFSCTKLFSFLPLPPLSCLPLLLYLMLIIIITGLDNTSHTPITTIQIEPNQTKNPNPQIISSARPDIYTRYRHLQSEDNPKSHHSFPKGLFHPFVHPTSITSPQDVPITPLFSWLRQHIQFPTVLWAFSSQANTARFV